MPHDLKQAPTITACTTQPPASTPHVVRPAHLQMRASSMDWPKRGALRLHRPLCIAQACVRCCATWATPLSCAGHGHRVTGLCLLPPGNVLASVSHDRCLRLWDLQTFRLIKTVKDAHETPLQVSSASSCNSSGLRGTWLAACCQQPGHCQNVLLQATRPAAWCITCTPVKAG